MLFKFVIILLVTVHGLVNGLIIEDSQDRNVTSSETENSTKEVTIDGGDRNITSGETKNPTKELTIDGGDRNITSGETKNPSKELTIDGGDRNTTSGETKNPTKDVTIDGADRNITSSEKGNPTKGVTEDGGDRKVISGETKNPTKGVTEDGDKVIDKPQDCAAIFLKNKTDNTIAKSGVYTIYPQQGEPFRVYCDMTTDGGGWTVIQRRGPFEHREDFYRDWKDYKEGFGSLQREFWLGNDKISILTNQDVNTLRFDLEDFEADKRYAMYSQFRVEDESDKYRMTCKSFIKGDAGDSFIEHNGMQFTTKDQQHDRSAVGTNCAQKYKGAWWYKNCHLANLNGQRNSLRFGEGLNWKSWHGFKYSLKKTEMKLRPASFSAQ